ncbi:MAG: group II truncated hemoglobin [Gammaproteobacteria bacterium]
MTAVPAKTPYDLIGGEAGIWSLVDRFYFYMDSLPEAAGIRKMHAASLSGAKNKLFKYLSGWLGGPDLYVREYGHPRLRMRHFPFAIGVAERDQWMLCMTKALYEMPMDDALRAGLQEALGNLATHMINQERP